MNLCGYLWIFVDIDGDICGQLEDTRGSLWIFVDLCGSLWIFVDIASSLIYMLVGLQNKAVGKARKQAERDPSVKD